MGPTWAPTSRGWSKDYTRYSLEDVWNSPGQIGCVWINTTYFYYHSHCPSMWVLLATPLVTVFWARAHPRQWGPLLALRWAGTQRAATAWESCVLQGLGGGRWEFPDSRVPWPGPWRESFPVLELARALLPEACVMSVVCAVLLEHLLCDRPLMLWGTQRGEYEW